jgi:hypothetical protein
MTTSAGSLNEFFRKEFKTGKELQKIIAGLFLVMLFSFNTAEAQLMDTISYSLHKKPRFFITLASHNTFIDRQYANVGGLRMGLNFNQRIRFGIGFFGLANNSVVTKIHPEGTPENYVTNGRLDFGYVSLSGEYFFYNDYPWQCTFTPFHFGFGEARYEYIDQDNGSLTLTPQEFVILYQPEVSAQYSIFRWLGVGVTTGYRFSVYRSKKLTQNLNAPTFAIDIRLFVDEVYNALFKKE